VPGVTADTIDLERRFPGTEAMSELLRLSESTGFLIETEYDPYSFGSAFALSNYVLTGNDEPQFLKTTELDHRSLLQGS
jgi:hypothetical protein